MSHHKLSHNKNNLSSEIESKIQQIKLYEEASSKEIAEASVKFEHINYKIFLCFCQKF